MNRAFVYTRTFLNNWKAIGMNESDLDRLEQMLLADPHLGAVIRGTGGARKMRFAYERTGKRGATRVIYVDYEVGERICFLTAYAKADKENLSAEERNGIKKLIELLGRSYNKK